MRTKSDATDERLPIGTNYCLCRACGEVFGGNSGFEFHRIGDHGNRRCRSRSQMTEAGYALDSMGRWRVALSDERLAGFAGSAGRRRTPLKRPPARVRQPA